VTAKCVSSWLCLLRNYDMVSCLGFGTRKRVWNVASRFVLCVCQDANIHTQALCTVAHNHAKYEGWTSCVLCSYAPTTHANRSVFLYGRIGSLPKRLSKKPIARNSLIHSVTVGVAARLLLYNRHKSSALLSATFTCSVAILGCDDAAAHLRAVGIAARARRSKR
jgi:hypothetical protein